MKQHPASSAILVRQGKILLVRRKNPPAANLHAFPGGKGHAGETSAQTALREFFEETGIEVKNPVEFLSFDLPTPSIDYRFALTVFLVEDIDNQVEATPRDDALGLGWFSHSEIKHLDVPPSVGICVQELVRTGRI